MSAAVTLSERLAALKPEPARVLVLDIETAPGTAYIWQLKTDYIPVSQVIEHPRMLCFAAKWLGDERVVFHSERDGREQMVEAAWDLLNEADIVVGYNHVRFDIPHLQREMVQLGYGPPAPWLDVDLLTEVRKHFRFLSNKLGAVLESLGLGSKDDSGGFSTWRDVLAGDAKAWKRMETYNKQDVRITAELFEYLGPWLRLPHAGLFTGDMKACAACGGTRLTPDGISRTKVNAYLRLACEDCCAHNRVMVDGTTRTA